MGLSLLGKLVKLLPRKIRRKPASKSAKAGLVNAETPRPTKEKENMKVRTQFVRIAGGGVLLGRRGRVNALPEGHGHTMSVFGRLTGSP